MANQTFVRYKLPQVRVTALNRCGVPLSGCSTFTDSCIVSIEETGEYKDREEWFPENGDGDFCATVTTPPKLKWKNLTLTWQDVNPAMIGILTGNTVLLDDDDTTTPNQIGYGEDFGSASLSNFALEGWTRIAATCGDLDGCPDDGSELFGYALYPWVKEGQIGDVTYQNDLANFTMTAIAVRNSPWGSGPYNVVKSEATATLGVPRTLFTPVPANRFDQMLLTKLGPPATVCDCQPLLPSPLTFADTGVLTGTLTLPLRNGQPIVPGYVNWGDASPAQLVTSGTTVQHVYGIAASYAPTYKLANESGPTYTAPSTPIA